LPDSLLILVPLLVLAVVLLVGFAGCTFTPGFYPTSLTFRAGVPTDLTVVGGVKFTWSRPAGGQETTTVTAIASGPSVDAYVAAAEGLGPALLWTLGNVDGLSDRSGNGRDGTVLGSIAVGGDPAGPTVFFDATATLFDGQTDGIGSSYNPFVGTSGRTFVGWARWDAGGPAEYTLFGSSAGDADRPTLRIVVANGNVKFLPSGDDGQVINWAAAAPAEDTWFMWALRADPGSNTASLFIDGTKVSDESMTDEWPAAPGTFQAAIGATSKQPFKGAQALIGVYERALTDAELGVLYQASQSAEDDFYESAIPLPEVGSWLARCEMTVRANGQEAFGNSLDFGFDVPEEGGTFTLVFEAEGSPSAPPFRITVVGLT
jgi:Concanavalin A-like lectin/glucanases superfamily